MLPQPFRLIHSININKLHESFLSMMKASSIVVASMLLATGFAVGATSPFSFCSAKGIAEPMVFYNQSQTTYCGVTGGLVVVAQIYDSKWSINLGIHTL